MEPVLRNAKHIAKHAQEKLWEFRVMAISGIHEHDVEDLCDFIAKLGPEMPVNFLAFRPNFVLEDQPGATGELMDFCVSQAMRAATIPQGIKGKEKELDGSPGERLAMAFARERGCISRKRDCGNCMVVHECILKRYEPAKRW